MSRHSKTWLIKALQLGQFRRDQIHHTTLDSFVRKKWARHCEGGYYVLTRNGRILAMQCALFRQQVGDRE